MEQSPLQTPRSSPQPVWGLGEETYKRNIPTAPTLLIKTGRNFAAGMSGGVAFVYDEQKQFENGLCNMQMVALETLEDEDLTKLRRLIKNHSMYTNSPLAKRILEDWEKQSNLFVKVMPKDYKKALLRIASEKEK